MKKDKIVKAAAAALCLGLLAGCGNRADISDGITVNDDGSVTSVIVEEFDESLYSVSELTDLINEEISEYSSENGSGKITAESPVTSDGNVTVTMTYAGAEDYSLFNNRRFSIESLDAALTENALNVGFVSVKDGTAVDLSSIEKPENYEVLITDEVGNIKTPGKILCFSAGVEANGRTQASVTDDMDGLAYIIYESK